MNYDALQESYWNERRKQVEDLRARISTRSGPLQGRVVPGDDGLDIGEGRRLKLAVMFLHISGFSQRPSIALDEQDLNLRVLNLFFTEMMKIAEDYGGTVEKNTGDGLMAYFEDGGYDDNHGTKRALAAALTMMASNEYL